MMKYQEEFIDKMTEKWLDGSREEVRNTIRGLKNKAQAAYIASGVAYHLTIRDKINGHEFVRFIHPNN